MTQNSYQSQTWKDYNQKVNHIDKIIQWALEKENQRICDKYSNIANTVKILKNLMLEFTKKADALEKNLISVARIEETEFQSAYYQKRIGECLGLSQKLKIQIENQTQKLQEQQIKVQQLKKTLMRLKTENVKISLRMEDIEQRNCIQAQKQNGFNEKVKRKNRLIQTRSLIQRGSIKPEPDSLKQENINLQLQLLGKIDKAYEMKKFIEDCFGLLRERLRRQEKKSNIYGLAGSMFFKIEGQQNSILPKIKKPNDAKLMIYDVLKQKYRKHQQAENKKQEQLEISYDQFMNFTPLQIVGVLQLKGGLKSIINKKLDETRRILSYAS